jgi:large subunit ribosomal protein L15
MNLDDVHQNIHGNKARKRIGRGIGSGQGKTAGKGYKGHMSRSGYSRRPFFQGGSMPTFRRIPKRGFHNPFAAVVRSINVGDLGELFDAGAEITPELLQQKGILKGKMEELKILGDGELTKSLKVSAHRFSASAKVKIEKAGGTATVLPAKRTPKERVEQLSKST